ncbi:hypothetical protein D9615_007247 [Tricholomella constricta]|uniref:Uncharacterized protein n=1 Tax=Tricholomella constricta TaxID=117010 RepID=A0A8H5H4Z1_9AGAR|nr:hypothetical protein D9615_007247 [Tricholomella constricta]
MTATTTTTNTVAMSQQTSSILLPASTSTSDFDGNSRMVRFDSECILIPERARRKTSKTYTLPLWKKRSSDSEGEATTTSSRATLSPEETHVVFKVPIPRFITRSPSRGRSTSTSPPTPKPLSPCLVNRTPSSLPSSAIAKSVRRTSLPISTSSKPKDDTALTVPLRACCVDCVPITEESLKEGEEWQEKFTRGARRRRSASLDNGDTSGRGSSSASGAGHVHTVGFAAVAANALEADIGPGSHARYRQSAFAITVDEVDKRRKSQEYTEEELLRFRSPSSSPRATPVFHSPNGPYSAASYLTHRPLQKEGSTSSTSSSISASSELSTQDIPPRRPKSSPIQEEDEDQLFPLPSPRRTPSNSPSPSANGSPAPSPSASTSCLAPAAANSKDSLLQSSSASEEGLLSQSLSRKTALSSNGLLSPHPNPHAPSALQPSALSVAIASTDRVRSTTSPGTSTPSGGFSPKPRPLPITIPTPMHARVNSVPVKPLPSPSPTRIESVYPTKPRPLPIPPSPISVASSPPSTSGAAFPAAASRSPSSSPSVPSKMRRPSFSLPAIKDAIKGASADVLKGVSSMGGGGGMSV